MKYDELLNKIEEARSCGKKVGLVQGSWDLFHLGHLLYILKARELCDFLIIAMDSDEKIRKRKGAGRPIIPEKERYDFLVNLGMADYVVIKDVNEKKWGLIRAVKPDVLIAIKENYSEEQINKLNEICGEVKILPRQSESSTSDKIRRATIAGQMGKIVGLYEKVATAIEDLKQRTNFDLQMMEPIPEMFNYLSNSTDWVCPVVAACNWDGKWYFGANHSDFSIPKYDIENRTELYYATTEHAEINLLKQLGSVEKLDTPIWTTLFPCDKCMKVLINKGVKQIYYLEDHPERNWSKRSHELAEKNGIETINILEKLNNVAIEEKEQQDFSKYKFIWPPNARNQTQLDIMVEQEMNGNDPLAPDVVDQEILFSTNHWYVSRNRFPYEGVEYQFLIASYNQVYRIEDMSPEMWNELINIWLKLTIEYNIPGGALCFRFGDPSLSGASLTRLHSHLIMPKAGNKARFPIGGKSELKKGLIIKERKKD